MWSTPRDRAEAERRARKLTPAQQRRREEREQAFNAGHDAALRGVMNPEVPFNFEHPALAEKRRHRFEAWEYAEDRP